MITITPIKPFYIFTVFFLFLVACGGKPAPIQKPTPPPPIDTNLLELAPAAAKLALWVNWETLRESPLWPSTQNLRSSDAFFNENTEQKFLFTSINKYSELVDETLLLAYLPPKGHRQNMLIFVKGRFDTAEVLGHLSTNALFSPITVNKFDGISAAEFELLALTQKTIVIGSKNIIQTVAKLADKQHANEKSLQADPLFEDFGLKENQAITTRYHRGNSQIQLKDLLDQRLFRSWLNQVEAMEGHLTLNDGFEIRLSTQNETDIVAKRASKDIKRQLRHISNQPILRFLGLSWVFDQIKTTQENNLVNIKVSLSESQLAEICNFLNNIQNLLAPAANEPMAKPESSQPLSI